MPASIATRANGRAELPDRTTDQDLQVVCRRRIDVLTIGSTGGWTVEYQGPLVTASPPGGCLMMEHDGTCRPKAVERVPNDASGFGLHALAALAVD
eukprot:1794886-Prymnesium_polylepis.1